MDPKLNKKYIFQSNILKALAHPTRLYIVSELLKKEKCVCEIQKLIGDDFSTISKHLTILKNAGIVECRKEGLRVFYKLAIPCIPNFINCLETMLLETTRAQLEAIQGESDTSNKFEKES